MYDNTSNRVIEGTSYDIGLREFMLSVFNNMALGLGITGVVSFFVGTSPELLQLFFAGPQRWVVILAPVAMVFFISFKIGSMSPAVARIWFLVYAAVMGLSLSTLFAVYKLGSVATIFFATSAIFGTMSVYGHTTKRDLSQLGSFLIMGVIGILIAAVINLFVQSSVVTTGISILAVLIFTALTAYDVQMLREIYYNTSGEDRERAGIMGALALYLDFINIFINLLQLLGERK